MMIIMSMEATPEQVSAVNKRVEELGFSPHSIVGSERSVIAVVGNNPIEQQDQFAFLPGVDRIDRIGIQRF